MLETNHPGHPLRVGSLFSGYGGLDLAVEHALDAETIWFCENNEPVARVFAHHWPDAPNLGDITAVDWNDVPPVDVLCGGFPCQDVSTVGKRAGLAPDTRSGLWSHMAEAIDALQPQLVVIENVRGLLSSPAVRAPLEGADNAQRNPEPATPSDATFRDLEPDPWVWETAQLDLSGQPAPYSAIWPTSGWMRSGSAYQRPLSALLTPDFASSSSLAARTLFRTPLATDSTRGGESLEQVRSRRGTIAFSHQIIDLALNGPAGSQNRNDESETLWSLIENILDVGDATPAPSPDGNTSLDVPLRRPHS